MIWGGGRSQIGRFGLNGQFIFFLQQYNLVEVLNKSDRHIKELLNDYITSIHAHLVKFTVDIQKEFARKGINITFRG